MSESYSFLKNLKMKEFSVATLLFVALICPGFIGLFVLERDFFERVDTLKLVLLSISLSLPAFTISFFLIARIFDDAKGFKFRQSAWFSIAFFSAIHVFLVGGIIIYLRKMFHTPATTLLFVGTLGTVALAVGCAKTILLNESKKVSTK